jgi:hypothetical protein
MEHIKLVATLLDLCALYAKRAEYCQLALVQYYGLWARSEAADPLFTYFNSFLALLSLAVSQTPSDH